MRKSLVRLGFAVVFGVGTALAVPAAAATETDSPGGGERAAAVRPAAPPTGEELSDAVKDCTTQVSNGEYAERSGGSRTVPVCATGNAVHWRSGMTIDCDGQRTTHCNPSTDPWWQGSTAWPQSDGEPLNAETLPFVVVPISSSTWDHFDDDITGGTVVAVVYQGKVVYGVVGDRGPEDAIGEGSYALAEALGIDPDPKSGGVAGKVVDYIAFPGVTASPIEDNGDAVSKGRGAAADLVAGREGCANTRLDYTNYPTLEAGADGTRATVAQCLLRAAGYEVGEKDNGDPSGVLDEATVAAVTTFQGDTGLSESGTVDSSTWTALLSRGGTPLVQEGSSGDAVRRVQRSLNAADAAGLAVDGQFGPKTTSAVRGYQSSRGLDSDGIVGANTWKAMQAGR